MIGPVPAARWWPAILLLCFDSGERIGAVMAVKMGRHGPIRPLGNIPCRNPPGSRSRFNCAYCYRHSGGRPLLPKSSETVFPGHSRRHICGCTANCWSGPTFHLTAAANSTAFAGRLRVATPAAGGSAGTAFLGTLSRKNTLAYLDPRIATPQQAIDLLWRPTSVSWDSSYLITIYLNEAKRHALRRIFESPTCGRL